MAGNYRQVDGPGVFGALSVSTSPVELKVGASVLAERVSVTAIPTTGVVYWGFDNTVTSSTGTPIFRNQERTWECGHNLTIFLVAASGTVNVRITETG